MTVKSQTSTPTREFWRGTRLMIPMIVGAAPFGVIFGAVAILSGLSPLAAVALSAFVFAGSSQFIGVNLVASGATLPIIWLTTFVVNLRHALYSTTLAPYVKHLPRRWLIVLGFLLTDEAFFTVINRYNEPDDSPHKHWYFLGAALALYVNWQIFTWIGIIAASTVDRDQLTNLGLDFALTVTFIGMLIPTLKQRPVLAAALVGGIVAVLTSTLPNNIGLIIAALAGVLAGVIAEGLQEENKEELLNAKTQRREDAK
ncbi:MAG: AzlC family ABC transporter permease [Chloroflexi bacterium]|uniref:AzlC family ABC transporter permease n=1 Tax=Candidatus Flexifilum breve TaxID=3140694 RepID=UPI0031370F84|nr:AzlC family ABC transporter permease [Chloroflexota bacterium]